MALSAQDYRYIHLNPLGAQVVADLRALERYPWTGHSALLGRLPRPWQETTTILAHFGRTGARGRRAYRAFVAAGLPLGRRWRSGPSRPAWPQRSRCRRPPSWARPRRGRPSRHGSSSPTSGSSTWGGTPATSPALGQTRGNVSLAAKRGAAHAAAWRARIGEWCR